LVGQDVDPTWARSVFASSYSFRERPDNVAGVRINGVTMA